MNKVANKNELISLLALTGGVGVEVKTENSKEYYVHETVEGIDMAYEQFNKGEKLSFLSPLFARQTLFAKYLEEYKILTKEADEADKKYFFAPFSEEAEENFQKAYRRQKNLFTMLCRKLIAWTGCDYDEAKKQIVTDSVAYGDFK